MGANAVTSFPTYAASEVLTAADLNVTNCGVPVFATTTTRDAAFGGTGEKVLAQGQLAYIEATNVVQYYNGTAWATLAPTTSGVVQVKSTTKSDSFTTTSTSLVDVTGLSVSITPTSASNLVLVMGFVTVSYATNNTLGSYITLVRGSTPVGVGDTAGNRSRITTDHVMQASATNYIGGAPFAFLDSPATTSATTYKIQVRTQTAATLAVNRSATDTDDVNHSRSISTITVFEVAP